MIMGEPAATMTAGIDCGLCGCAGCHEAHATSGAHEVQSSDLTGYRFTPGQTVFYTFNADHGFLSALGVSGAGNIVDATHQGKVSAAFDLWEAVANIRFEYTDSWTEADVGLYWDPVDGYGGTLGYAAPLDLDGDGLMENADGDGVLIGMDPSDIGFDFSKVILHEIGHALGLGHISHSTSVMAPYIGGMADAITDYDITVVQSLYGAPVSLISGPALISGSDAADYLVGGSSTDQIHGGAGNDIVGGADGADLLYGNQGVDRLDGGAGSDTIYGGQNGGALSGDPPAYREGADTIGGGDGADLLYGNHGGDLINAGTGDDTVFGGQDDDWIVGWEGNDLLNGNLGQDTFAYFAMSGLSSGEDTIVGFEVADDRIQVSAQIFSGYRETDTGTQVDFVDGTRITVLGVTGLTSENFILL